MKEKEKEEKAPEPQVPKVTVTKEADSASVSKESSKEDKKADPKKHKKPGKSKNTQEKEELKKAHTVDRKTVLQKKEKADRAERMEVEANLARQSKNLAAMQERMYSIRYADDIEPDDKVLQLRNFAANILYAERQLQQAFRESVEIFEDQLDLNELHLDGLMDGVRAAEIADTSITRTGSFMRTPSTQTVQGQEPKKKWQSLLKMHKEGKEQKAIAHGQFVASRDVNLHEIDEEILKLRAALRTLSQRKNLKPSDERAMETMQEQLRVRVQQKERLARAIVNAQ